MRKIKYGRFLLFLIFVMSIVYSGGDVGSSKVVHANETAYDDFYPFPDLPESDIVLTETFELITAEKAIGTEGVNDGPSLDLPNRPDVAIITQNKQWQFGGLWYKNEIDMKKDFSMRMYVNLGDKWDNGNYDGTRGADGITFTIQGHAKTRDQLSSTIGANGAGLGAYSKDSDNKDPFNAYRNDFISNALVLEFDTFYNNKESGTNDNGTPNFGNGGDNGAKFYGHIDLTKTRALSDSNQGPFYKQHVIPSPNFRSPDNLQNATNQDLTDNRWRKVEVSWDSSTYKLTYDIAGYSPIVYQFSGSEEVEETFGGTKVYWGFTGSTGDSYNLQQVGIFEVPDQTESSIEKLARNITKDGENAEFTEEAIMKLGDTIEYQVTLDYPAEKNTQDIKAAVIEDKLPAELEYVDGSLRVQLNGSDIDPTPDWNNGEIHLGDFKPGNTFVVTYQAVVEEEVVIENTATFYSKYTNPISDTAKVYSGSINILKVDGTNQPLEGAEFTIEGPNPNSFKVTIPRSGEDLPASYKVDYLEPGSYKLDYLEPGEYTITETKAPDGYLPATEPQKVNVSKGTVDLKVTFTNYKEPDVFKEQRDVNETDWGAETTTLVGKTVDFRLSAIAPTDIKEYVKFALSDQIDSRLDYTAGETKVYINDLDTPLVADVDYKLTEATEVNNTLEVSLTKDRINQLTAGDKLYVEFSAVVNESALGAGPIENTAIVDWDNGKGDIGVKESLPTFTTPEEGTLTITKVAKNDNNVKLAGATFKLQRLENGEWLDVADSSKTTGETGKLTWNRLVAGNYRLVETEAPAGYNLLANPIEFIIDDGVNLTHEFLVENIFKEPDVFKEQRDVNETNWGAETTTLVGKTVDFRLSAIAPTDIEDYVKFALSDQIEARVDYTAGSTTVYINDLDTTLVAGDDYILTEATEENNRKLEVSLTEAGIARLTAGDKLYVEFSAVVNESAIGEEPIKNFAIVDWDNNKGDIGNKKSEPTLTRPKEGTLTITKVAKNDNNVKLAGATFKLQRLENEVWLDVGSSKTTDKTGEITWDRLVAGKYRLIETVAPAGYNLLANPKEFIIDDGVNLTHEFLVENIPKGELPQTGGIGTAVFTITGLLLMMSAGLSSLITRIKKNN